MKPISAIDFIEQLNSGKELYKDLSVVGKINMIDMSSKSYLVNFEEIVFNDEVLFDSVNQNHLMNFRSCKFRKGLIIRDSKFSSVKYDKCSYLKPFRIINSEYVTLSLNNLSFDAAATIDSIIVKHLGISSLHNQNISVYNPHVEKLALTSNTNGGEVYVSDKAYDSKYEPNAFINELDIYCPNKFSSDIYIQKISIDKVTVTGSNVSGRIFFRNNSLTEIAIENFVNDGYLLFNNISTKPGSSIIVKNSNLGKAEIFNVDFTECSSIQIEDAHIENIISSNVTWCNRLKMNKKDLRTIRYTREAYRQIKNIMIKSNNKPEEIKFWGYEMDAYTRELSLSRGRWDEKIILISNRYTNYHGLSWFLPFLELVMIDVLLYALIKRSIGYTHFNVNYLLTDIVNYCEFINPLHSYIKVFPVESNWGKLFDVFARILSGYLIYQFLRAFRRFVKN